MERMSRQRQGDFNGFFSDRRDFARETFMRGGVNWAKQRQVEAVQRGHFGARLSLRDTSRIYLEPYSSPFIEIDGDLVDIGPNSDVADLGVMCLIGDNLIDSQGHPSASFPAASTTYYAYVSSPRSGFSGNAVGVSSGERTQGPQLRLSATAPVSLFKWTYEKGSSHYPSAPPYIGAKYLGTTDRARCWRFVGWVRTTSGALFADSETQRFVVNYHNRIRKDLFACAAYNNNAAETTYTTTSTTWVKANAGTGSKIEFVSNGEDAAQIYATQNSYASSGQNNGIGVSDDNAATGVKWATESTVGSTSRQVQCLQFSETFAEGYVQLDHMIKSVNGNTMTVSADGPRAGASQDPYSSFISGSVMA